MHQVRALLSCCSQIHDNNNNFSDAEYEALGCTMVDTGSWPTAPHDAIIFGLKVNPKMIRAMFPHPRPRSCPKKSFLSPIATCFLPIVTRTKQAGKTCWDAFNGCV